MKKSFFLLLLIFSGCSLSEAPSCKLAICAIFKNEAPWLKEWIEYHRHVLKVEHFYLYQNESTDDYLSVLKPYIDSGLVDLFEWDSKNPKHLAYGPFMDAPWNAAQIGAYNDCLKNQALGVQDWVAMIDIDEFIVPLNSVHEFYRLLKQAEKHKKGSVSIHWRTFGTSNVKNLKSDELLTEKLIWRSPDQHPSNKEVKSIHRPEAIDFCLIHIAELKPGFGARTFKSHQVQLNHYWTRTESLCQKKRREWPSEYVQSLNSVKDTTILKYLFSMPVSEGN